MTQYAFPNGDATNPGSWTASAGSLWAAINDATSNAEGGSSASTASDADYIASPTSPSNAAYSASLGSLTDPVSSTGHILRYRYAKSATSGRTINLTVTLQQGTTTIASWTHNGIDAITTATQTLTGAQADAITDYSQLRFLVSANATGGGAGREARVYWVEFECPGTYVIPTKIGSFSGSYTFAGSFSGRIEKNGGFSGAYNFAAGTFSGIQTPPKVGSFSGAYTFSGSFSGQTPMPGNGGIWEENTNRVNQNVPNGFTGAWFKGTGGGGRGGSGATGSGSYCGGGAGGGGGAVIDWCYLKSTVFGSQYSVNVGAADTGGGAGSSQLSSGSLLLTAGGGGAGSNGQNNNTTNAAAGGGGIASVSNAGGTPVTALNGTAGGAGGKGAQSTTGDGFAGVDNSNGAGAGGGGGGGMDSFNFGSPGFGKKGGNSAYVVGGSAGRPGGSPGSAGGNGNGGAGAGGGSNLNGSNDGGAGGNGGAYGGGGGGGSGAGISGKPGGNGAVGYSIIGFYRGLQPTIMADDFTTKDTTKWAWYGLAGVTSGQLSLPVDNTYNNRIEGNGSNDKIFNLTNSYMSLQCKQKANNVGSYSYTMLRVASIVDPRNTLEIGVNGNTFYAREDINGSSPTGLVTETWDITKNGWWRIAHRFGQVCFDVSGDGQTWRQIQSFTPTMDITNVQIIIRTISDGTSPGTALFDNFCTGFPATAAVSGLSDTFTSLANWDEFGSGTASVAANTLSLSPTSTSGYKAVRRKVSNDLRNGSIMVELPSAGAAGQTWFYVWNGPANTDYVGFYIEAGVLYCREKTNAIGVNVSMAYNATNHRWLRISESNGTLSWDVSANGITWTNVRRTATASTFGHNNVTLELYADGGSGTSTFKNLNTAPAVSARTDQFFAMFA